MIRARNWYFAYCLLIGVTLPFLLLFGLGYAFYHTVIGGFEIAGAYIMTVLAMGLLRTGYAIARTGELAFLLLCLYGFVHLVCVVPLRVIALFTLTHTQWGTR